MNSINKISINAAPSCILIDDDELLVDVWQLAAEEADKSMLSFASIDAFLSFDSKMDRTVPVYIDSKLGNGVKGEIMAKKLYELGFKNLYLATGYLSLGLYDLPWIKAVVSKEPPF